MTSAKYLARAQRTNIHRSRRAGSSILFAADPQPDCRAILLDLRHGYAGSAGRQFTGEPRIIWHAAGQMLHLVGNG